MTHIQALCLTLLLGIASHLPAAIIGTNPPARPLTSERTAGLPAAQQSAWREYLDRSTQQRRADEAFLQREKQVLGIKESFPAPTGKSLKCLTEKHAAAWYHGPEARRLADIVVSFQTPAGGWG